MIVKVSDKIFFVVLSVNVVIIKSMVVIGKVEVNVIVMVIVNKKSIGFVVVNSKG